MTTSHESGHLPDDLISLKDAARVAGDCHPKTIRRWIDRGLLTAYRRITNGQLYVSESATASLAQPVVSDGAA